jgi:hypothetical protein
MRWNSSNNLRFIIMNNRRKYWITYTKREIGIIHWIDIGLLIFMFSVFIRDSLVYDLPFYYVLSILSGFVIGRMMTPRQKLKAESTLLGIIIILLLLGIRFFAGNIFLKINEVVSAPALYLLFIGIYYSIMRNAIRKISERVHLKHFTTAGPEQSNKKHQRKIIISYSNV